MKIKDLGRLFADIGEAGIDTVMDEGFLKNIPIFNTLINLKIIVFSIKDKFFMDKLSRFIFNLEDVTWEERIEFFEKYYNGEEVELGEKLVFIIDKYDDSKKPEILAHLLKANMREYINHSQFLRLGLVVDRCFIDDLYFLKQFDQNEVEFEETKSFEIQSLANNGLVRLSGFDGGDFTNPDSGGPTYTMTELGLLLKKYGLDNLS